MNEKIENFRWKLSADGEIRIEKHYVDGYDVENRVVYQFHRCFYHGCMRCYSSDDYNSILNMSFGRLKANRFCYALSDTTWEHDYKKENNIGKSMISSALLKFDKYLPLRSRQALYGGRTYPIWLKKTCVGAGKINYVDFTSLYPSVQKDFSFPIGHPSILISKECDEVDFDQFCGLIKCDILPLKNLYFPVLPCKFNGKLFFTLCRSCVHLNADCHHSDEERTLTGVWCSPEIKKALEMGYEMKNVYQIYKYESIGDIFSSFVRIFWISSLLS